MSVSPWRIGANESDLPCRVRHFVARKPLDLGAGQIPIEYERSDLKHIWRIY